MEYRLEEPIEPHMIVIRYTDWKRCQRLTYLNNAICIAIIKKSVDHQEKLWYMNNIIKTVERNIDLHDKKHTAAIVANINALKKAPSQS
jgi:hypothetical protein